MILRWQCDPCIAENDCAPWVFSWCSCDEEELERLVELHELAMHKIEPA